MTWRWSQITKCRVGPVLSIPWIMDKFDIRLIIGVQKPHKSNCCVRINEWRIERMHGWISELIVLYIPGTMVSVCVFSHILKMDDALIGAMSCVSKILSSFVYAFSTTDWQIYLGTQPCMSNTLSTRSLRAHINVSNFLSYLKSLKRNGTAFVSYFVTRLSSTREW